MIYITSSELSVTNYDRIIDNYTFPYRNENILIFHLGLTLPVFLDKKI